MAHLNVLDLRGDVYVDPEDWSTARTKYLDPIPAGGSTSVTWGGQAVNSGRIGLYVAVLDRSGTRVRRQWARRSGWTSLHDGI